MFLLNIEEMGNHSSSDGKRVGWLSRLLVKCSSAVFFSFPFDSILHPPIHRLHPSPNFLRSEIDPQTPIRASITWWVLSKFLFFSQKRKGKEKKDNLNNNRVLSYFQQRAVSVICSIVARFHKGAIVISPFHSIYVSGALRSLGKDLG